MVTEAEFQGQVCEAAELLGWRWRFERPARTSRGWRTAVSGPLGVGWPDLQLTRERDGRMILAELKSQRGIVRVEQQETLDYLRRVARVHGWLTVAVWRPSDWERLVEVLT